MENERVFTPDLLKRHCPTCMSDDSSKFIESRNNPLELDFDSLGKLFIGYRKEQCFFSYYECNKCSTLYCKEYFNQSQLDALYSRMPDNKFGLGDKAAYQTQLGYAKQISKSIENRLPIKILEVGPDLGLLSLALTKIISVEKIVFVEPNLEVHRDLIETFKDSNIIVVLHEKISQIENVDKFDLIVGIHVLDHLIEPLSQIRIFKNLLTDNGKIAFVTHDFSSSLAWILKKKWPPFCLQHPQLYSDKVFKNLSKLASLNHLGSHKTTNWLDLGGILLRILGIFGVSPKFKGSNKLIFPIRLGNIVSIFDNKV